MYIKEFEELEVVLNNNSQCVRWQKNFGFIPEINKTYSIHWTKLKTKKEHRLRFIKVKCDDCGIIFERRIRDLNPKKNYHLCKNCFNKGNRNGRYGKSQSENQILALEKWKNENDNPFTWDSVKEKIKLKEKETIEKRLIKTIGQKRTSKTKEKMRLSAIEAFKDGRRKPNGGWGKCKSGEYCGILYQGTYELKFLKYLENINKLNIIERGPRINYFDSDGKEHNYYIDFMIKNTNVVFEIKSDYLWNKKKEINEIKMEEAKKLYDYNLIINNDFKNITKIFENYD